VCLQFSTKWQQRCCSSNIKSLRVVVWRPCEYMYMCYGEPQNWLDFGDIWPWPSTVRANFDNRFNCVHSESKKLPLYIRSQLWQILASFKNYFTVVFSKKLQQNLRHISHNTWAFNLTLIMLMVFRISCLLILRTLVKCYCVNCSRISPVSFIYILQGSAANIWRVVGSMHRFCCKFLGEYSSERIWKLV